jgi:quinol monooxygenase YgiN
MVLYVNKWNIHPDKVSEYLDWSQGAIRRTLSVPGVDEFRAYRGVTGTAQVVITYEFADMAAWEAWYSHETVQEVVREVYTLALNVSAELWGPSPVVLAPIRPGQ